MVQIMQFLHMHGDPLHFLSNVLNSEILSIVLIPLLIEFHNLAPSYIMGKRYTCMVKNERNSIHFTSSEQQRKLRNNVLACA